MRDILVSSGGVKAGKVPQEHAQLECAPVVVVGGCGYRDPLGAPEGQCEPAEGLFLLDSIPVANHRVALLTEAPMSTPPAVLAATTLLGSVVLIEGSEVHCALTLRHYLRRVAVLQNGNAAAAPGVELDNVAARGYEGSALAKAACEEAAATAQTLRLQREWPCPMPMLRVVIVEAPSSAARTGPLEQPTLPCVMAATTAPEIDVLLRAAGECLFSSVVITRCRDGDAGSVTHDVVTHAPPKRLGPSMRPMLANAWLALVADAYGRVLGWRHITGRSTIGPLCEKVNEAVDHAIGASAYHHAHSHHHPADLTATAPHPHQSTSAAATSRVHHHTTRQQLGGATSANASMTSLPQLNGSEATLVAEADDAFADLLRQLDGAKRRVGVDGSADARARLEASLLDAMRPHWQDITRYAAAANPTTASVAAGAAAVPDPARAAELDEALRVADEWIPSVLDDLTRWRDDAAAAAGRPLANAALVPLLLQWVLPNAAAVARTGVAAAAQIAQRKLDESRRRAAAFEARAATAEARVAEMQAHADELERRLAEHAAASNAGANAGSVDAAAAKQVEADCQRRLQQAAQRADALDRKVTEMAAAIAEDGAFWRRRHASSEFLATNYGSTSGKAANQSPHRVAASFAAGLNRTASPGRIRNNSTSQASTGGGAVDADAMRAEIAHCYDGIAGIADKVASFAAEYSKAAASTAAPMSTLSGQPHRHQLQQHNHQAVLDQSSIAAAGESRRQSHADPTEAFGESAVDGVRAARLAAAAATSRAHATQQHATATAGTRSVPIAPSPPREQDPHGPAVRVPSASERPSDGLVPLRDAPASSSPRRGDDADVATPEVLALRAALERATGTLAELQSEFEARGDAVDRARDLENDLRSQLESARATATRLMQDNEVLREETRRLMRESVDITALRRELEARQYEVRTQASTLEAFSNDKRRHEQALLDANENRTALERELAETKSELRASNETRDADAERVRDLEQELYAANSARKLAENNVDSLQTEIKVLRAEFDELEIDAKEQRTRNADLASQMQRDGDAYAARIASLQSELQEVRTALEECRAAAGAAEQEQEAAIDRLTRKSQELQGELESAVAREHQAHQTQSSVYSELTHVLVERDALKASLADHEKRVERAAKSLSLLRDENMGLRQRLSSGAGSPARLSAPIGSANQSRHVSPEPWRLGSTNVSASNVNVSLGGGAAAASSRAHHTSATTTSYHYHSRYEARGPVNRGDPVLTAPRPLPALAEELCRQSSNVSEASSNAAAGRGSS